MKKTITALAFLAAACSGGAPATQDTPIDLTASAAPCPTAGEVLTEDIVNNGCVYPESPDMIQVLGVWDCTDGSQLWGGDGLWAWVGEEVIQSDGETAADPGYQQAYQTCTG